MIFLMIFLVIRTGSKVYSTEFLGHSLVKNSCQKYQEELSFIFLQHSLQKLYEGVSSPSPELARLLVVKALILIHKATSKDLRNKSLATGTGWTSWVFMGPRSIRTAVLGCIRLFFFISVCLSFWEQQGRPLPWGTQKGQQQG